MGGGHDFSNFENCHQRQSSVELRHSDEFCDECYEIQEYGMELSEDTQTETQTEADNHEIKL